MIWVILGSIPILAGVIFLIVEDWRSFVWAVSITAIVLLGVTGIMYGLSQMGVISEPGQ